MFLKHAGDEEYAESDVQICRFVARALKERSVAAIEAEYLVAEAAREIGVARCVLDYEFWSIEAGSRP